MRLTRTLNTRQLPQSLVYAINATVLLGLSMGFDANANIQSISNSSSGAALTQSFQYDGLDRLQAASAPNSYLSANYSYDAFDNIRTHSQARTRDGSPRNWTYDYNGNNRLIRIRDANNVEVLAFGYDSRGHTQSAAGWNWTHDRANTLQSIIGSGTAEQYRYDAHGHRTEIQSGQLAGTRYPLYRQSGQLLEERGPNGTDRYIDLGNQPIVTETPAGERYVLTDALGSNVASTDASGNLIERSEFAPFGERWNKVVERGPGYTGHFEDTTGLSYMKARFQSGLIGRFVSPDPVQTDANTGANFNRYWYGNNNPTTMVDPDVRLPLVVPAGAFIAKELAGEAVERATGVPAPTIKNAGKVIARHAARAAAGTAVQNTNTNTDPAQANGDSSEPEFTDIDRNKAPWTGNPGSTVRGGTGSRTYGDDGYPLVDRDTPHPDESGYGNEDHSHDWGRPSDGGPPSHSNNGLPRPPRPGDPPKPRGPNVPKSEKPDPVSKYERT